MDPLSAPHHFPGDGHADFDFFLVKSLNDCQPVQIRDLAEWCGRINSKACCAVVQAIVDESIAIPI